MLRRGKFSRIDTFLVWLIGLLLAVAGLLAIVLAFTRRDWRIGLAGAGAITLAGIYLVAAVRRRPL